jgi:hypothetical protein
MFDMIVNSESKIKEHCKELVINIIHNNVVSLLLLSFMVAILLLIQHSPQYHMELLINDLPVPRFLPHRGTALSATNPCRQRNWSCAWDCIFCLFKHTHHNHIICTKSWTTSTRSIIGKLTVVDCCCCYYYYCCLCCCV